MAYLTRMLDANSIVRSALVRALVLGSAARDRAPALTLELCPPGGAACCKNSI